MKKRLTVYDLAKKLGCSPSTVSRAYNGRVHKSWKKRSAARAYIDKIGWHPNFEAGCLAKFKTNAL